MSSFSNAIQLISVPDLESNDLDVVQPFALLTAYRNSFSSEENEERTEKLADRIKENELQSIKIEGGWDHFEGDSIVPVVIPEDAFVIHSKKEVTPEEFFQKISQLAMEFQQDAFLFSDGKTLQFVRNQEKTEIGDKVKKTQVEDLYALMRNQQEKFVFSSTRYPTSAMLWALSKILDSDVVAMDAPPPAEKPAIVAPAYQVPADLKKAFKEAAEVADVPSDWGTNKALIQLAFHESSLRTDAKNPASSAFGLFQLLKSTWEELLPEVEYGTEDPLWQIVGGMRYIKKRYKTPERALAFWQATVRRNADLAPEDLKKKAASWISRGYAGY